MLNMSILDIKSNITLNENDSWNNRSTTNCYAFALGLDIPEKEICENAYQPGVMASNVLNIPLNKLKKISIEERMILDFKVLKLGYEISKEKKPKTYYPCGNYWCDSWDILLFLKNHSDFHFARVNSFGELYHKVGWFYVPFKTSVENIEKQGYKLTKTYRLRNWKREI